MALFGFPAAKQKSAAPQEAAAASPHIFDAGSADFETSVLAMSMQKPVLVDFWAPWCGPCKQLMPVLEAEINAAAGEVVLAKVNIDENPELAQALRIQSVPTVLAFFQGQPVTGFTGVRPASDIKNVIAQLVKLARSSMPDAIDIPAALKEASEKLAAGDIASAQNLYLTVLQQDENNIEAYNGLVRLMLEGGALDQAEVLVANAPDLIAKNPAFSASRTALEFARGAGEAAKKLKPLLQKVETAPGDHQVRFDLAAAQFASGQKEQAIDNLLAIMTADRGWNNDAARLELLKYFEALGFADPLSVQGRKKLSRLLFS